MGKKNRRQNDPGVEKGEASDSSEDNKTACEHVRRFKKNSKTNKLTIKPECKNCKDTKAKTEVEENPPVESSPPVNAVEEDLLVCITCGNVGCSESVKGHAKAHQKISHSDPHDCAFYLKKQAIYCIPCQKDVHSPLLECAMKNLLKRIESPPKNNANETELPSPSQSTGTPFLSKELCSAKKKQPLVKGLMNLGNTCFFNSVLQCLAQTPYLIPVLERLSVPGETCTIPGKEQMEPLVGELNTIEQCTKKITPLAMPLLEQLKRLRNYETNALEKPAYLLKCLKERYKQFEGNEQHDAHELLRHLLEGVRTDDLKRYQEVILKKFDCYGVDKTKKASNEIRSTVRDYGFKASDLLLGPDILFRGELISLLQCQECLAYSHRTENFLDLSLPVTEEKPLPPTRKKDLDYYTDPSREKSFRKEKKERKRLRRNQAQEANQAQRSSDVPPVQTQNSADTNGESDHSDADVEDNAETDTNVLENRNDVIESGYSSEKAQNGDSAESVSPAESGCAEGEISPAAEIEPDTSLPPTTLPTTTLPTSTLPTTTLPTTSDGANTLWNNEVEAPLPFSIDEEPQNNVDEDLGRIYPSLPLINEIPASPTPSPSPTSLAKESDEEDVFDFQVSSNLTSQECERSDSTVNECGESDPASDMPKCSPTEGGEGDCVAPTSLDVSDLQKRLSALNLDCSSEAGATVSDKSEASKNAAKELNSKCALWVKRMAQKVPPHEGDCSVISCLSQFTAPEIMACSNKVGCDNCTKNKGKDGRTVYTNATKQLLIGAPPAILIMQLKRFIADVSRLKKMNRHVSFPMTLDLAPFCSTKCWELPSIEPEQSEVLYSLYGVVEHSGQMGGGHYVAYVKVRQALGDQDPRWKFLAPGRPFLQERPATAPDAPAEPPTTSPVEEKWYYVSDSHVSAADEDKVKRSQAYLLFYERIV